MTKGAIPPPLELKSTGTSTSGKFASSVLLRSPACPSPELSRFPSSFPDPDDGDDGNDDLEKQLWQSEGPAAVQVEQSIPVWKVLASVSFYVVAAVILLCVNKAVLNASQVPIFFLWCQLVIAAALLRLCAYFGYFELPQLTSKVIETLSPLIAVNVCGLALQTYCLSLVDASYYQVVRGLNLPITVLLARYFLKAPPPSAQLLLCVVAVCAGFAIGVFAEIRTVSALGLVFGVISSVTTAVHAIVVKRALSVLQGDMLELAWFSNLLSAIILAPICILVGEGPAVLDLFFASFRYDDSMGMRAAADAEAGRIALVTFLVGAGVSGLFGFLICLAALWNIKITSPVSHMMSGATRIVLQTALGVYLFGDIVTAGRVSGIAIILAGTLAYTYFKSQPIMRDLPAHVPISTLLRSPSTPSTPKFTNAFASIPEASSAEEADEAQKPTEATASTNTTTTLKSSRLSESVSSSSCSGVLDSPTAHRSDPRKSLAPLSMSMAHSHQYQQQQPPQSHSQPSSAASLFSTKAPSSASSVHDPVSASSPVARDVPDVHDYKRID